MEDQRRVEQSRFGVKIRFIFEDERLTHTIRDSSGERTFNADYELIGIMNTSSLTINNRVFAGRFIMISFAVLMVGFGAALINDFLGGSIALFSLIVMFGLIACNLLNVFEVRFILVPLIPSPPEAQGHPLRIIDDGRSGSIIGELEKRRMLRLKVLYGKADLTRDPAQEIERLRWLRDNAVLSDEELELEIARVEEGFGAESGATYRNRLN